MSSASLSCARSTGTPQVLLLAFILFILDLAMVAAYVICRYITLAYVNAQISGLGMGVLNPTPMALVSLEYATRMSMVP